MGERRVGGGNKREETSPEKTEAQTETKILVAWWIYLCCSSVAITLPKASNNDNISINNSNNSMAFFVDLWESVFTPGTNPALIHATHTSFVLLVLSLMWMIYTSRSIHFFNLLIIALCLWASVTWFLSELEKEKGKLKTNQQLAQEASTDNNSAEGETDESANVLDKKKK